MTKNVTVSKSQTLLCLVVLVLGFCVPVYSAQAPRQCAAVLAADERLTDEQLHFAIGETGEDDGLTRVSLVKESGKAVGYLDYSFKKDGKELYLAMMKIKKKNRDTGLGTLLLAETLRQNPNTQIIWGKLALVNEKVLVKAWLSNHLPLREAFKETPAYKMMNKLGFGNIISIAMEENFGFFPFRVSRSKK